MRLRSWFSSSAASTRPSSSLLRNWRHQSATGHAPASFAPARPSVRSMAGGGTKSARSSLPVLQPASESASKASSFAPRRRVMARKPKCARARPRSCRRAFHELLGLEMRLIVAPPEGDQRRMREPHENRQRDEDSGAEQKGVVHPEQRRLLAHEIAQLASDRRGLDAGGFELRGDLRQQVERGEAPAADMVREIELMERRAAELHDAEQRYAIGAGDSAQKRELFRGPDQLRSREAVHGETG